ncbi:MAG: hypothetical protein V3T65_06975 [Acidobacteriota bacterium]
MMGPTVGVWKDGYVVYYGTGTCFRCRARFEEGERFKLQRFTVWPTPNRPESRVRLYHGLECPDGSKKG